MKKIALTLAVLAMAGGFASAQEPDTVAVDFPVYVEGLPSEDFARITAEDSTPLCGRYHNIRVYRATTCAGQIFEDIEMDAPGGA